MKLVPYSQWMYGTKWTIPINVVLVLSNLFLYFFVEKMLISLIVAVLISVSIVYLYQIGTRDVDLA